MVESDQPVRSVGDMDVASNCAIIMGGRSGERVDEMPRMKEDSCGVGLVEKNLELPVSETGRVITHTSRPQLLCPPASKEATWE
jgi:hypothetical protein